MNNSTDLIRTSKTLPELLPKTGIIFPRSLTFKLWQSASFIVGQSFKLLSINQTRTDILEAMKSSDSGPRDHSFSDSSLIHATKPNDDTVFRENAILQHLGFPSRYDRYENVAEAHAKTFNWIFKESTSKERAWSSFTEWLKGDDSIYWIYGKAGVWKVDADEVYL